MGWVGSTNPNKLKKFFKKASSLDPKPPSSETHLVAYLE